MFSNLEFFIVEALRSFRRGSLMSLVAIGTITVALVIFGLFVILVLNLGNIVGTVSSRMDISAYVEKDLSLESAGALQLELSRLEGVEKVDFISRTEAWRRFKQDFGSTLNLDELLTDNPLPHTFSIKVRAPELLPVVAKRVSGFQEVEDVRYSGNLIEQIKSLVDGVRIGGAALVILISIATLLIVVNTIRLTVLARETDISIMKLVGATNTFVKWPFIIEGVMIGVLGGFFSFLVLKFAYDAFILRISVALPFLPLVGDQMLLTAIYAAMVLGGTALGMMGAYISVSRVLKAEI
jgi:cell division transport system permease protein